MRKLCPNVDREDGLATVLEVPIPEEMFTINKSTHRSWQNMKCWIKPNNEKSSSCSAMTALFGSRNTEIQLLLGVVGAPLIPLPIRSDDYSPINKKIKDHPIVCLFTHSSYVYVNMTPTETDERFFFLCAGCFNGVIYCEAVHSSSGRREGVEFCGQHVRNGEGENGGFRIFSGGREFERQTVESEKL